MSELVPAGAPPTQNTLLGPLTDPAGGTMSSRLQGFASQPAVRRMLPVFVGLSALGVAALTWSAVSTPPQRTLYAQIDDGERASVAAALDAAAIDYAIDNTSGALTVGESDFYRARMLVAADGAVATPQTGTEMLDSLPMGASRMLEGERLRAARERDLTMTIQEIDGVESVRVHLAEGEKSVFVRENVAPTASVMVRLAKGRQLSGEQIGAIVNLVAGSVPGLSVDAVRVVDQHGQLLSDRDGMGKNAGDQRLELQSRMEDKLRTQVAQLLTPMLGAGNFTSEIQVELDMDEVTSARESYDKDGVVRSETQQQSQSTGTGTAGGVPGMLSNTPPAPANAEARPPESTPATSTAGQAPSQVNGESSSSRTFELGREVSVANVTPGGIKRVSVAVAISKEAMKGAKAADIQQIQDLVSAAVGANVQRGDQVKVMSRSFETVVEEEPPFYETPWFATIVRNIAAVLCVLMVLLLGVRPIIKALRRDRSSSEDSFGALAFEPAPGGGLTALPAAIAPAHNPEQLNRKVGLAQRLVNEQPDSAVAALRQMLNDPEPEPGAKEAA
ncbi:MAG TPA: flagellar basal-body MS-ring/collar protein FliF [Novosphingobium sp.]|nr:flagellar basal-body MS-ring/collar protein FliF [Novosphingobium sp.]